MPTKKEIVTNERSRLQELIDYQILDTPPEAELDELAKIASLICNTPISLITMIDGDRQWFKANIGLEAEGTSREDSFCQHAFHHPKEVLVVNDSMKDDRFKNNPLVLGDPNIRFYAGAPLETPNGNVLGTLCVIDRKPREIADTHKQALQLLAKKAMDYLNARKLLAEQRRTIENNAAKLKKLTDQVPGAIFQFRKSLAGTMSFEFLSQGILRFDKGLDYHLYQDAEKLFDVIHCEDVAKVRSDIQKSFAELSVLNVECRVLRKDGKVLWCLIKAMPERLDNGDVVWYGSIQNITRQVEYGKTMEQIAFDISHVLRRPVTSLLTLTSIIEQDSDISEKDLKSYAIYIQTIAEELELFTRQLNETYTNKRKIIVGE